MRVLNNIITFLDVACLTLLLMYWLAYGTGDVIDRACDKLGKLLHVAGICAICKAAWHRIKSLGTVIKRAGQNLSEVSGRADDKINGICERIVKAAAVVVVPVLITLIACGLC